MELMKAIRERRSTRSFKNKKIPAKVVEELKEAAVWAPSAGNLQSRFFYFVSDPKKIGELCKATMRQYHADMPLCVVGCVDYNAIEKYGERGHDLYCIMDVAASTQNLLLAAHAHGLGSVWCSAFDEDAVRKALNIPKHLRPIVFVPIGYPASKPAKTTRKPLQELVKKV